jgi:uncharacterized membrane protein
MMKQAMFAQQKQGVKTDPRIKTFSWLLILYGLFAALQWFEAIAKVLTGYNSGNVPGQVSLGSFFNSWGLPIFWTVLAVAYVFVVRMWRRFDQKRQAAAQGDQSLLATEQPVPDAQAVSLPLTIRMRSNRRVLIIMTITLFISLLIPFIIGLVFGLQARATPPTHPVHVGILLIILGVWALVALLVVGIMYAILYVKAREQVTLTDYGILVSGVTPRLQSIPWSEARLFAIVNPSNPKRFKDRLPLMLEVASEHNLVRWTWLRSKSFRSGFAVPVLPPEEYEQQMRGVLSVIAAKTGLPLYDLRKKQDVRNG